MVKPDSYCNCLVIKTFMRLKLLKKKYQRSFSEILNAIGLLWAMLMIWFLPGLSFVLNIEVYSNNVFFNIFLIIFGWHLYGCAINIWKVTPLLSYQTILDRFEFQMAFSIQKLMY